MPKRVVRDAAPSSGTIPNEWFSAKELCILIKGCKESEVSSFSYKDLTIKFGKNVPLEVEEQERPPNDGPVPLKPQLEGTAPNTEEYLGELLLSDPGEYERLIEKESYLNGENDKGPEPVLRRGEGLR